MRPQEVERGVFRSLAERFGPDKSFFFIVALETAQATCTTLPSEGAEISGWLDDAFHRILVAALRKQRQFTNQCTEKLNQTGE